jgi:hypothetical protein
MKHITQQIVAAVLNSRDFPDRFDAHHVEHRLLRLYPIEFAEELLEFRNSNDPLLQFSAAFAQWLDRTFAGQIQKTSKVVSANLGNLISSNQEWEKTTSNPIV